MQSCINLKHSAVASFGAAVLDEGSLSVDELACGNVLWLPVVYLGMLLVCCWCGEGWRLVEGRRRALRGRREIPGKDPGESSRIASGGPWDSPGRHGMLPGGPRPCVLKGPFEKQ